jgi:hypothetical protein
VNERYAYRAWRMFGGLRVSPLYRTPAEAGAWRRAQLLEMQEHITLTVYDEDGTWLRTAEGTEVARALFA